MENKQFTLTDSFQVESPSSSHLVSKQNLTKEESDLNKSDWLPDKRLKKRIDFYYGPYN